MIDAAIESAALVENNRGNVRSPHPTIVAPTKPEDANEGRHAFADERQPVWKAHR